jgi:hypothetical protein
MWSEEEVRDIEPEPPQRRTGAKSMAGNLRSNLAARNLARIITSRVPHELTRSAMPSVIYAPQAATHGNFIDASYRRICANPAWAARLAKPHTAKRQARRSGPDETIRAWCELDTATSSDALLMNIFCYPRVLTPRLCALLGVEPGAEPEFGYRPRIELERKLKDRTEIDMRLGTLLVEAKLTESDFQCASMRLLERYPSFDRVFDREMLEVTRRGVHSYQLIRGVMAAHAEEATFCVLLDARRPDLIEAWYAVMRAVSSYRMQARLRLLTWQEVAAALPAALQTFLDRKYGITVAQ